jgi:hypothetical protein
LLLLLLQYLLLLSCCCGISVNNSLRFFGLPLLSTLLPPMPLLLKPLFGLFPLQKLNSRTSCYFILLMLKISFVKSRGIENSLAPWNRQARWTTKDCLPKGHPSEGKQKEHTPGQADF